MPHKPVAIVAAMPVELAPLLKGFESRPVDGVEIYDLPQAIVGVGGIGEDRARRATKLLIDQAQPHLVVSAGIVGAINPRLKVGDVGRIREVMDVATGERYRAERGDWVLATSQDVSDAAEKLDLHTRFGADVVDMEGAAVAQVAKERGIKFVAIKAVSDDADFVMPPLNRFIDDGKFATRRFMAYIVLHPNWWGALRQIKKNSEIATENLCVAVKHLIDTRDQGLAVNG